LKEAAGPNQPRPMTARCPGAWKQWSDSTELHNFEAKTRCWVTFALELCDLSSADNKVCCLLGVLGRRRRVHTSPESTRAEWVARVAVAPDNVGVALESGQAAASGKDSAVVGCAHVVRLVVIVSWIAKGDDCSDCESLLE
jgi:hypothetical protein